MDRDKQQPSNEHNPSMTVIFQIPQYEDVKVKNELNQLLDKDSDSHLLTIRTNQLLDKDSDNHLLKIRTLLPKYHGLNRCLPHYKMLDRTLLAHKNGLQIKVPNNKILNRTLPTLYLDKIQLMLLRQLQISQMHNNLNRTRCKTS